MLVCECRGLTDARIRALIQSGVPSLRDLESVTGVGSECGDCRELLAALWRQETEDRESATSAAT